MDGTTKEKARRESGRAINNKEEKAVSTTLGAITAAVNIVRFSHCCVNRQK